MNVELKAPPGKYRVVGVDTFDGTDWIDGDYDSEQEARKAARKLGGTMQKSYIYTDEPQLIDSYGTF